jgi:hypothetical protein
MVTRGIYYGMGIVPDPDVDDYYTKAHGDNLNTTQTPEYTKDKYNVEINK